MTDERRPTLTLLALLSFSCVSQVPNRTPKVLMELGDDCYGLATDGSSFYVAMGHNDGLVRHGAVVAVPVLGGVPVTLWSGSVSPSSIAVGGRNVYWTDFGGAVRKASVDRNQIDTIGEASLVAGAIAADEQMVVWRGPDGIRGVRSDGGPVSIMGVSPGYIAIGRDGIYWQSTSDVIEKATLDGSAITTISSDLAPGNVTSFPGGLVLDESRTFWVDGRVMSAPKQGGMPLTILPSGGALGGNAGTSAIAVDEGRVYSLYESLVAIPKAGGSSVTLVGETEPRGGGQVVLNDESVVFISGRRLLQVDK